MNRIKRTNQSKVFSRINSILLLRYYVEYGLIMDWNVEEFARSQIERFQCPPTFFWMSKHASRNGPHTVQFGQVSRSKNFVLLAQILHYQ